jgi:glycosyltransferase involved in cell wall biosynthesis
LVSNDIKRNINRIVFFGHIIRSKGVYELVEVCSQIKQVEELVLIGPYEEDTKRKLSILANKSDKGVCLKLTGILNKKDVLQQMLLSQIIVLPSYTEGFPNVVLEAMSMGCAVVATNVGAIPEMLALESEKPCGICVPPRNIEMLKAAILTLINDPGKAEIMGNNGKERVLNNYTLEKVISQYKSVWEEALK